MTINRNQGGRREAATDQQATCARKNLCAQRSDQGRAPASLRWRRAMGGGAGASRISAEKTSHRLIGNFDVSVPDSEIGTAV